MEIPFMWSLLEGRGNLLIRCLRRSVISLLDVSFEEILLQEGIMIEGLLMKIDDLRRTIMIEDHLEVPMMIELRLDVEVPHLLEGNFMTAEMSLEVEETFEMMLLDTEMHLLVIAMIILDIDPAPLSAFLAVLLLLEDMMLEFLILVTLDQDPPERVPILLEVLLEGIRVRCLLLVALHIVSLMRDLADALQFMIELQFRLDIVRDLLLIDVQVLSFLQEIVLMMLPETLTGFHQEMLRIEDLLGISEVGYNSID